jgi:CBS domain-containing protein
MTKIRELMTEEPACCTRDTSIEEVARLFKECDCGMLPVIESEQSMKAIGAITDRDIVCRLIAEGKNPLEFTVEEAMTRNCISIDVDGDLDEAAKLMEDHQIRRLIVVDEDQVVVGVLSQADIARADRETAAEVVERVSEPSGQSAHF